MREISFGFRARFVRSLCIAVALVSAASAAHAQFADEFNGAGAANSAWWTYEEGGGGFGNNELQCYTGPGANGSQENGYMRIQARNQASCAGRTYSSARLKTQNKVTFGPYTSVSAALRGPMGPGLWPAFWMLGNNIGTGVAWPGCGEIDIMEHINANANVLGTIHWSNDAGAYANFSPMNVNVTFSAWNTYAIEWNSSFIRWIVNGTARGDANILNGINGTQEFHQGYFVLLNLAVGGNWPGPPSGATTFPANYDVDYVRSGTGGGPTPTNPPATATATTPPARSTPTPTTPPAGGTLLSQGRPATASSSENAGTGPANAVDGNTGTRWSSAFSDPQWITVDLGSTASITRVRLNWEAAFGRAYTIQVSPNNTSWTTLLTVTAGDGGIDDHNVSGSGRYVRMNGTVRATAYGYSLWEFEVYGTAGGPTPTTPPRATATSTARPRATATSTTPPRATATTPPGGLLSQGRPVVASSIQAPGTAAANAVDGITTSRWSSAFSDPQWIYVDLGSARQVSRVVLNWEAAYGRSYTLQSSNDAVNWTPFFSTTTGNGAIDDLTVSANGRYIRMHGTARATAYGYSLWEFQVYGN